MRDELNEPLVSIVVVTYNSSKFVLETLESVYKQTYKNIELIITDDCSKDNTIELCRDWLVTNKKRFINTKIVEAKENTGIGSNSNRGLAKAKGEWVKFIAGDDCLIDDCLKLLVDNIVIYKDYKAFLTNIIKWDGKQLIEHINFFTSKEYTINEQTKDLLLNTFPWFINGIFFHRDTLLSIGAIDTTYSLFEDYPTLVKFSLAGHRIKHLNFYGVLYRIHEGQITNRDKNRMRFEKYSKSVNLFYKYRYKLLIKNKYYLGAWHCWIWEVCSIRKLYINNFLIKIFLISIIDPYYLYFLIIRAMNFLKKRNHRY